MANLDPWKIFVSSTMTELRDPRAVLRGKLQEQKFVVWVHELDAGARPDSVTDTSLKTVDKADIYLGLFDRDYGEVTIQEFHRARELGKPCFIYIRGQNTQREQRLAEFLREDVLDAATGLTPVYFNDAEELGKRAVEDIMAWLLEQAKVTMGMRGDENRRYAAARDELDDVLRKLTRGLDETRREKLRVAQDAWESSVMPTQNS